MEDKPVSSNSVASSEGDKSQKQEAFTHLAQGKRHLLVRDYDEAVTSLAQACSLLSEEYGECANECADAYFNYGKALLELARTENGVLGDAIEGDRDDSNDEDEEDDEPEEKTDETENGEADKEGSNDDKDDGSDDKEEIKDQNAGTTNENTEKKEQNGEDEDEISNLKLAWEMLELAKIIFLRQAEGNNQFSLKLAEVYLKLGEVGLESECYQQATEDMQSCLKIQIANLPEDSRFIAETYYQLGVAYSMNNDFDKAIEEFNNSADLIEKRIKNLEAKKEAGGDCSEETKSDPFYTLEGEITELKALLPEVKEKVTDMNDFKMETMKALCGGIGQQFSSGADGSSSSGSTAVPVLESTIETKPVSNISHLVRKKRKPDEENKGTEDGITPAKQAKSE